MAKSLTGKSKQSQLVLKNKEDNISPEKEVAGVLNAIKDDQIKSGMIPDSGEILVENFAGKVLSIDKSCLVKGKQYWVKSGTKWEDISQFCIRHINFRLKDFK